MLLTSFESSLAVIYVHISTNTQGHLCLFCHVLQHFSSLCLCLIPKLICIFRYLLQQHPSSRYQILHQHPIAVVTNYWLLSGLSDTNLSLYSSAGQKSDIGPTGLTSRNQHALFYFVEVQGQPMTLPFLALPQVASIS